MSQDYFILTIPHASQRYDTCGDWWIDCEGIHVRVSRLADWRYELLVGVHELIEAALCKHRGITGESVDAFDTAFEATRAHDDPAEPGDHPSAPYHREHAYAEGVERSLAQQLNVNWRDYELSVRRGMG